MNTSNKQYFCEKCGRTHHIFTFAPSSRYQVATCGTAFDPKTKLAVERTWTGHARTTKRNA